MNEIDRNLLRDPLHFAHLIVQRGEAWAEAEAAASMLEETRRSVQAQVMTQHGDIAVGKAEALALASDVYRGHVTAMVQARRDANVAKVRYDGMKALMELTRSAEASRRVELGLK